MSRPKLALVFLVVWVSGALTGAQVHALLTDDHCPTEDSCSADYRADGWHIEAETP